MMRPSCRDSPAWRPGFYLSVPEGLDAACVNLKRYFARVDLSTDPQENTYRVPFSISSYPVGYRLRGSREFEGHVLVKSYPRSNM